MSQATPAELLGIIKGLTDVAQQSHKTHQQSQQTSNEQIQNLTAVVEQLQHTSKPQTFRLPQVQLPVFSGTPGENLERFLENFESLLQSSGVSFRLWCPYLKQQIQNHQRGFDSVILAEKDHLNLLGGDPSKASESKYV